MAEFTVRIPDNLAADLALVARVEGTTAAEIVREALRTHLCHTVATRAFRTKMDALLAADEEVSRRLTTDTPDQ
jgi:predicted transcriptional regulator